MALVAHDEVMQSTVPMVFIRLGYYNWITWR